MKVSTPSQYALLGFLSRGPHSGYDIKKALGESTQHFWGESYGQIYPNLKKLAEAGLATRETKRQDGKPDRKVYTITQAGREALLEWLAESPNRTPPRNELLLKLFFAHRTSPKVAAQHVERYKTELQTDLTTYQEIERWLETDYADHPALPYWLMTLSYGRLEAEALLKWCDETLETLLTLAAEEAVKENEGK